MKRVNGSHYSVYAEFPSGKIFTAQFKDEAEARNEANKAYKMGATEITLSYVWYTYKRHFKTIKEFKR